MAPSRVQTLKGRWLLHASWRYFTATLLCAFHLTNSCNNSGTMFPVLSVALLLLFFFTFGIWYFTATLLCAFHLTNSCNNCGNILPVLSFVLLLMLFFFLRCYVFMMELCEYVMKIGKSIERLSAIIFTSPQVCDLSIKKFPTIFIMKLLQSL